MATSGRSHYIESVRVQLGAWKVELDETRRSAKAAAAKLDETAAREAEAALAALGMKEQALESRLTDVERASDDAWEMPRISLEIAWDDLRAASRTAARFEALARRQSATSTSPLATSWPGSFSEREQKKS